jgi:DNA transformation protein
MTDDQAEFVLAKLRAVGPVVARRMFGGVGFYLDGSFFALLLHDRLYFKTNDANRGDFEAAGMEPFRPFADRRASKTYFEVPERVLQNRAMLKTWSEKAVAAARTRSASRARKKSRSTARKESSSRARTKSGRGRKPR